MAAGRTLEGALRSSLEDFDGSFCYLAATKDRFGFVKDRFGFKPLMLAETDDFVALATEEIALRRALGRGFVASEPAPGTVRICGRSTRKPPRCARRPEWKARRNPFDLLH